MKVRHIPAVLQHYPVFAPTYAPRMFSWICSAETTCGHGWARGEPRRSNAIGDCARRVAEYVPPAGREADASTQQGLRPALQM